MGTGSVGVVSEARIPSLLKIEMEEGVMVGW